MTEEHVSHGRGRIYWEAALYLEEAPGTMAVYAVGDTAEESQKHAIAKLLLDYPGRSVALSWCREYSERWGRVGETRWTVPLPDGSLPWGPVRWSELSLDEKVEIVRFGCCTRARKTRAGRFTCYRHGDSPLGAEHDPD